MSDPGRNLNVPPGPGVPGGLNIPAGELVERYSRSPGPGGQSVNTADSRVELLFDPSTSLALSEEQRARLAETIGRRLVNGRVVVVASEHRSQWLNRSAARDRLAVILRAALAPPPPPRRPTRPTRGSQRRRLETKKRRGAIKSRRGRPREE